MTQKSASKKTQTEKKTKTSIPNTNASINRRREWRFELPLTTEVQGKDTIGKTFKEETTLENISSQGAYFCLDSGVTVGSKLNLMIDLPTGLTEGKKVKLCLGGLTVRLEKPNKKGKQQGVAIRFKKEFKFISEEDAE
ncbi:MAG: PilZ domain-containing protein [Candidatus Aminicenantes bacterium]|nr:PilZ domain-containing protein [Candidatus Aminicenantes bacterium]